MHIEEVLERLHEMKPHSNMHTLNREEVDTLLAVLYERKLPFSVPRTPADAEDAETYRREKPSLDAVPLKDPNILDYGQCCTKIDLAIHHLDEGLPLGQKTRCRLAYYNLNRGVYELGTWMQNKGYFKEDTPPTA